MHVNQTDSLVISCQIIFHDDVAANSTFHFDLESRLSLYQGFFVFCLSKLNYEGVCAYGWLQVCVAVLSLLSEVEV